jgi:hypothetical protein
MYRITLSLIFILSLFAVKEAKSQVNVAYYGNIVHSKIGIGYEFNETWWADLRIYSGTSLNDLTPEVVLVYNFMRRDRYKNYVGAGMVLNYLNGFVAPLGVRFTPFENYDNLSFHIEFQPMYEFDLDDFFISGLLGLRFKFN